MTDHKSEEEKVKNALRCCAQPDPICKECPYYDADLKYPCADQLKWAALNVIDRQEAKIERLQAVHADMTESLRLAAEANKDMSVELDAMRGAANSYKMHYENARAEAIKEFAQRLIDKCTDPHWCVWMNEIEDLVTEMTENKR